MVTAFVAPVAAADVYEGTVDFAAPPQPPSLSPETPIEEQSPYLSSGTVSYDSAAGTATVSFSYYEPSFWAQQTPNGYDQQFGLVNCGDLNGPGLAIDTGALPPDGRQGTATLSGYDGQATAWETFDGTTYSTTFTSPAFVGQAWNCATFATGFPETQIKLTDVTNPPIPETTANASAVFLRSATANAPEPSGEGPACPEYGGGGTFLCEAEYLTGSTVRLLTGTVQWDDNGHPAVSSGGPLEPPWTRRWHVDSQGCLRYWGLRGRVSSNFPCAGDQIATGSPRAGASNGSDSGYWPWLNSYPCHRHGGVTTCSNALGDSYQFSRYPTHHP